MVLSGFVFVSLLSLDSFGFSSIPPSPFPIPPNLEKARDKPSEKERDERKEKKRKTNKQTNKETKRILMWMCGKKEEEEEEEVIVLL